MARTRNDEPQDNPQPEIAQASSAAEKPSASLEDRVAKLEEQMKRVAALVGE